MLARLGHTFGLVKKGARCVTNLGCFALFACLVFLLVLHVLYIHGSVAAEDVAIAATQPHVANTCHVLYKHVVYIFGPFTATRVVGIESNPARGTG